MRYDDRAARERVAVAMPHMAVYYLCILKKGPRWTGVESPELEALQAAHLANFERLGKLGKVVLNGPLLDQLEAGGELRGLSIFKTASLAEAQALAATDPMVNIGHLVAEIHPWMIRAGALP